MKLVFDVVVFEGVVAVGVAALGEIAFGELVFVDDDDATGFDLVDVDLESSGVHGDHGVDAIAGGVDVVFRELDLEARDAEGCSLWCSDLGGEVWEGCEVVSEDCCGIGELAARELHSIAGVAAESDDDGIEWLGLWFGLLIYWHWLPFPFGVIWSGWPCG